LRAKAFGSGCLSTIDNSHASDIPQGSGSGSTKARDRSALAFVGRRVDRGGVSGGYAGRVRLAVGDVVVYPSQGGGPVVAREHRLVVGAVREVVVVELADGLS
jgi:hypothetical protein